MDDMISVDVYLVHETPSAWLVHEGDPDAPTWVPKSQCELEETGKAGHYLLWMPEWLAEEKDFI
jgi:hypothetical protein